MLLDAHTHLHGDVIRYASVPRSLQRNCVARVLGDRNSDEVFVPHDTRRRVEVYPTGTGNITLDPSVGVTAVNLLLVVMLFLPKCT